MKAQVARIIASKCTQRDSLLFVYGTLRPLVDIPMARWLQHAAHYVGPGRVRGRLYDLGPYPGLRPACRSREWVAGDVYRVRNPLVARTLDSYEAGSGHGAPRFLRGTCVVSLGRRQRAAWVYVYQRSTLRRSRIAHGDYLVHCARR